MYKSVTSSPKPLIALGAIETAEVGPFDQGQIDAFCERTRDRNPIHRDPAAALQGCRDAKTRIPPPSCTVVPGMLITEPIPGFLGNWLGDGTMFVTALKVSIHRPLFSGETVYVKAKVDRIEPRDGGSFVEIWLVGKTPNSPVSITTGRYRLFVPATI